MIPYLQLYPEIFQFAKRYTPEQRCHLYEAMAVYAFEGKEPDWPDDAVEWYAWEAFKQKVDAMEAYQEKQRANGMRGGRPRKARATEENQEEPTETHIKPEEPNLNPNSNSNSNSSSNSSSDSVGKRKRFTPPTLEEVRAYVRDKGYAVDPERFIAYYESNGWRVGKNPMRDWKAAIRTWVSNGYQSSSPKKTVIAQQYEQRDYSQMPDDSGERMQKMMDAFMLSHPGEAEKRIAQLESWGKHDEAQRVRELMKRGTA